MRDELRAGLRHRLVRSGRFGMPVRIDDRLDAARKPQDIPRMLASATIHKETSAVACKGDDVVPGPGNKRHLVGEFRSGGARLRESRGWQTNFCRTARPSAAGLTHS